MENVKFLPPKDFPVYSSTYFTNVTLGMCEQCIPGFHKSLGTMLIQHIVPYLVNVVTSNTYLGILQQLYWGDWRTLDALLPHY